MDLEDKAEKSRTGPYESAVQRITEAAKPTLREVTHRFVEKSVDKYAKDNPKFARIIEFEVRRRGDGAGLTQDVAEPLLWTGIKTVAAISIAVLTKSLESQKFKMLGYASALGLVLNNAIELLRVVPRYKAGLQGSLEMAKDRWRSIEETGVDPFSSQSHTREINKPDPLQSAFIQTIKKKAAFTPTSLIEQVQKGRGESLHRE